MVFHHPRLIDRASSDFLFEDFFPFFDHGSKLFKLSPKPATGSVQPAHSRCRSQARINGRVGIRKGIRPPKSAARSTTRIKKTHFIPDGSRPGSTTAVTGVDQQAPSGDVTVKPKKHGRGGRHVQGKRDRRKMTHTLRVGSLNVGTMTGKGREVADLMERRRVNTLCVQETKGKGSKARCLCAGYKLYYYGVESGRNDIGIVLEKNLIDRVLEVTRETDRIISMKLDVEGIPLIVISAYAPQVGSGGRSTQFDYVLCKRRHLKEFGDCEVILGEGVAKQHRLLVVRMTFQVKAKNRTRTKPKIKWWKLKEKEFRDKLQQEVEESCGRGNHCWKSGRTKRAV